MSLPYAARRGHVEHSTSGLVATLLSLAEGELVDLLICQNTDLYPFLCKIEDKADFYALLRAAPRLYNVVIPVWWEQLTINLLNDYKTSSQPTSLKRLIRARSTKTDRLQFVKSVVVEGTSPPLNYCIHRNRIFGKFFANQSNEIAMFLRHLRPNTLKHFSWTTATCMADSLISPWGSLTTLQQNLEGLKLVLSAKCADGQMTLGLGCFRKLKYLSLRGLKFQPRYPDVCRGLQYALLGSCSTLKELELAFVPIDDQAPYLDVVEGKKFLPIPRTDSTSSSTKKKAEKVEACLAIPAWFYDSSLNFIPVQTPTDGYMFPNLRVLHLEMINLRGCAGRLFKSIDVASMTSLTLRHCAGWKDFLVLMAGMDQPMSLRSLELEYYESDLDFPKLTNLLDRCANIESVAMCDANEETPLVALEMWKAVCHGRPSLRRFVHHQTDHYEKMDFFTPTGDTRGRVDLGANFIKAISESISSPDANPFTDSNLEFLGICSFPTDMLVGLLRPLVANPNLRVIHFRKSAFAMSAIMSLRRALDHFVRWAFGWSGIPSLKVILFGDYSSYRVRKGANCRYNRIDDAQDPNWEVEIDPDISDLPASHVAMAKACPSQFII